MQTILQPEIPKIVKYYVKEGNKSCKL